ncbi:uncharacterized protein ASCRUDRAFT_79928 [Ascoidea rubescens DSM 1968]|uniref:Uncharacterized protein n=1 Tax=Ascoidea rubescens DSM 1968 TaxID=1344418 RepID=A0A1D2VLC8_9ASCO|nr:hypothetical protein ASCRUDRAFT_79928 [Ascoidea rubescens DSM 1968]ODV62402.1 hypothetical protein ASCRUDRAFT_79928 [Ascoidea rubescens DSM 1968]
MDPVWTPKSTRKKLRLVDSDTISESSKVEEHASGCTTRQRIPPHQVAKITQYAAGSIMMA